MQPLNRLGLRIVMLTTLCIVVIAGIGWGIRALWHLTTNSSTKEEQRTVGGTPQPTPTDTDSDGLPDEFEVLYRTDPAQADSDGDGTTDLAEIDAGRDPALAGPNDESKPATGSKIVNPTTYTQRYLAQLPDDAPRDAILDKTRLEAFVNINKGTLLPDVPVETVKTTNATGKEAIVAYLDAISPTHNPALKTVTNSDIEVALAKHIAGQNAELDTIIANLEHNSSTIKSVATPAETVPLHRQIIAATDSLLANTKLLRTMADDFVGGLIGTKNIEELGPVFQDIATQIQALEKKYEIEP